MQIITRLRVPLQRGPTFLNYNLPMFKAVYPFASGGYESLVTQLNAAATPNEVFDQWRQNKALFKNEHLVLSLRMLGRYSKFLGAELQQSDENKQAYSQINQRLESSMGELSEFDLIDVLFWLRKARQNKVGGALNSETYSLIFRRIGEFVTKRVYSFRNLVNIYYDLAMLGRSTDLLIEQMTRIIKTEATQITPFIAIQILQAGARRCQSANTREWIMLDSLIRQLNNLLEEFDLDQKSSLFRYISFLEMNYHFPTYKIPPIQYTLRTTLLNKLESLSEFGVLNVVTGYQNLPVYFPVDLLDEIKDMVSVTIENNASNLKHVFLLEFTELISQIPKRKLDEKYLNNISAELAKRLMAGDLHLTHGNLDRVARIFNRQTKSLELTDAVYHGVSQVITEFQNTQKVQQIPLYALEFLVLAKREITDLLSKIQSVQVDRLSINSKLRLYGVLAHQKNESFSQLHQTLYQSIIEKGEQQPEGVLITQETLFLQNREELRQINSIMIVKLRDQLTQENVNKYIKSIYLSIQDNDTRVFWTEWMSTIQITRLNLQRFTEEFELEPHSYNGDNIKFFLDVISMNPAELHISKLLSVFQNNQKLTLDIARSDNFVRRLFEIVRASKELRPIEVRLIDVLQLVMRFEATGVRSEQYRQILKKCYELDKAARDSNDNMNKNLDAPYLTIMMKYKCLTEEEALSISDKAISMNDVFFKSKIFGLAQQAEGGERVDETVQELVTELTQRFNQEKMSLQLLAIPAILSFKPTSYEHLAPQLLQSLKDNSAKISDKLYIQLLQAIPRKWMSSTEGRVSLLPFLKELQDQYPLHSKKANFGDLLTIMEAFVYLRSKNTPLFNNFLNDLGRSFNSMTSDQRVRTLKVFSQAQIRQLDVFQKILEKINENPRQYKTNLGEVSINLFRVGVNDELSTVLFTKYLDSCADRVGNVDLTAAIQLLCIMTNDTQEISKYVNLLKEGKINQDSKFLQVVQAAEYLISKNQTALADKLKLLISNTDYEKVFQANFGTTQKFTNTQLVSQLLTAMDVQHEVKAQHGRFTFDIYIPSQKIIIQLVKPMMQNHDNQSFSGQALLKQKVLESVADHTVVQFGLKELEQSARSSIDKVNFLIAKGIKSNKQGNYDLSEIQEKPRPVRKVQKKEEVVGSGSDAEDESEAKRQ